MVEPDKNWSKGLFQGISSFSYIRKNADVNIWVKSRPIRVHKFVLEINSDIMDIEDVTFNVTDKMYQVKLSAEFEENFDLFSTLITSLYTGIIEIKDEDAEFVYKFAKTYNVQWLWRKTFVIYQRLLTQKTFINIFQFSHSICCEDLKRLCLSFLSNFDVFHVLLNTGELLKINYYCIKTVCSSGTIDCLFIHNREKFKLVCSWFEADVPSRMCHLENLISLLEFNTLQKSDLAMVYDWIIRNQHIDDNQRLKFMKVVNTKANTPI